MLSFLWEGDLREVLHLLTTPLAAGLDPPMEHYGWVLNLVIARMAVWEGRQVQAHTEAKGSLGDDDLHRRC